MLEDRDMENSGMEAETREERVSEERISEERVSEERRPEAYTSEVRSMREPESAGSQPEGSRMHREENRMNMSHIPSEPTARPHRKRSSLIKTAAGIAAGAVFFGILAGGTMFAVNTIAQSLTDRYAASLAPKTEAAQEMEKPQLPPPAAERRPASAGAASNILADVSGIVEEAMPSVVAIHNTMIVQQQTWFGFNQQYEAKSSGSGIIIGKNDDELLIATNNHVVEDSKDMTVSFIDDTQVSAAIKGTDSESDLAVIAVALKDISPETMNQIKIASIGDSDALKVGQGVIAIGNALGYGQSVTVGYVSALNRDIQTEQGTVSGLLQTDAAINPGNSGGALLNMYGEVIGINAAKYSSTAVEGMGYAIPISKAETIIGDLMNKRTRVAVEEKDQGYLGIQGNNIDETAAQMYGMPRGIYVFKIMEDSAAAKSGLREKDIITRFDGQSVRSMAELKQMLTYYAAGTEVELTVQSLEGGEYKERTVTITLGKREPEETN